VARKFGFVYLPGTFRPIAFKQLNSLTAIDTFSGLGGPEEMQDVPGSDPSSGKDFYVRFCVLLWLRFYLFVRNTLYVTNVCNSFLQC